MKCPVELANAAAADSAQLTHLLFTIEILLTTTLTETSKIWLSYFGIMRKTLSLCVIHIA